MMPGMSNTRELLVDAASALLENGGPDAVTLREVGRRAGVSHNAPYKHFADKEELLAAVAARDLRGHHETMARLRRTGTPYDIVAALVHGYVRHALDHPELFRLTYGPWRPGLAELAEAADAARGSFVDAVEAAQASGELAAGDPERVAALLLAMAHGAVDLALAGHLARDGKGRADPQDLVDDLLSHLATTARARAARTRRTRAVSRSAARGRTGRR
jgi:AcrR family transcriptional regulator